MRYDRVKENSSKRAQGTWGQNRLKKEAGRDDWYREDRKSRAAVCRGMLWKRQLCDCDRVGGDEMLWRKKEKPVSYDKTGKIPVLHVSICTGEKVAGFKDTASGRFEDRML